LKKIAATYHPALFSIERRHPNHATGEETMTQKCFHNFSLFDGLTDELQTGKIILVRNDSIEKIEEIEAIEHYPKYERVDLDGLTLLPGLIDAHIHPTIPLALDINFKVILQMNRQVGLNLANCVKYGVTTIRDMAAFSSRITKWKGKIDAGKAKGPRILTAKSFISCEKGVPESAPTLNPLAALIAGGQFVERVDTPAEVERVANRLIDGGASWLKTQYSEESLFFRGKMTNLSDDCFAALMDVSRKRGVRVAMHHTEATGFKKGVKVGVHTLEHCAEDELDEKDVDRFVEQGMAIIPTLKAPGDFLEIETVRDWLVDHGKGDFMPEPYRQALAGVETLLNQPYPPQDYLKTYYYDMASLGKNYPVTLKNVEKIKAAGGKVGVGTDMCGTGLCFFGSYWKELLHLTRAGFSNFEALKAATSVNAEIIGLQDHVGSIEPGKYADFTLISGNPLEDIETVGHVEMVVKSGEII
jgi:imidazolonepropionase-like amidohydrolase